MAQTVNPMAGAPVDTAHDTRFFGHPRGLSTLFFTEMWERFSYYGMRALLILYMTASTATGGMGLDVVTAGAVYGMYTSMVYIICVPGGWIADRILGMRKAVLIGGIFIAVGGYLLAMPWKQSFFLGLVAMVIGTGLLKPNVSTLVGTLYGPNDKRRDSGFSIYYMGINLGAFFSPLVCGYVGQKINWHYGFGLAGVGMTFGLIQYMLGQKHLGTGGIHPAPAKSEKEAATWRRQFRNSLLGLVGLVAAGSILSWTGVVTVTAVGLADFFAAVLLVTVVVVFGMIFLGGDWTPLERNRLIVIAILFVCASLFWASFEQAGSTLNLFAQRNTDNTVFGFGIPASWYQALNALFIITLAPVFAWLWVALGDKEPSLPVKFALGLLLVGFGFVVMMMAAQASASGNLVSPLWLVATYLLHTFGELCLSPVGLSAMTRLAPERIGGLVMGVWFLGASVGNFIGGRLAGFYESMALSTLFGTVSTFGLASGLLMLVFSKPIRKLMGMETPPN